ncbi:uncharacterized protein B4U79_01639 [Dinothrombium tinctorium]|uniref:K Homology domain-containing protein n=1 Tax=Dinothrombium tinctorium TaxID=1965070 RepID=A0A3S3PAX6_9ACAR|nr:uncharacterized protein B4U79_01639 [Dinothrombium tinctorium]
MSSSLNPIKSAPGFVDTCGRPAVAAPSILQATTNLIPNYSTIQNAVNNNSLESESTTPTSSEDTHHNSQNTLYNNNIVIDEIELFKILENLELSLSNGNYDQNLIHDVCCYLKANGSELDNGPYKDQLDLHFNTLRNISRDSRLDSMSRTRLLEVIELRAVNWTATEEITNFYQKRYFELETNSNLIQSNNQSTVNLDSNVASTFSANNAPVNSLAPSEVIKPSGKFSKPAKVPGKNFVKDEFVIRNSDSGKVMGIRGRRVHLIEELSDTVISFQRVNSGAKERLLQITGANEESISRAKYLIEDTIKRNASPIPPENQALHSLQQSNYSSSSLHQASVSPSSSLNLARSSSNVDNVFGTPNFPYIQMLTVNNEMIIISSSSTRLGEEARLVLENYFNQSPRGSKKNHKDLMDFARNMGYEASESSDSEIFVANSKEHYNTAYNDEINYRYTIEAPLKPSETVEIQNETSFGYQSSHQTQASINTSANVAKDDPKKPLQRSASQGSLPPGRTSMRYLNVEFQVENEGESKQESHYIYDRDFLLECAKSPLSNSQPKEFDKILAEFPEIVRYDRDDVVQNEQNVVNK